MSKGYVYILSNPAMPGLLKIGKSIHGGKHRANQLFQTGTPAPFVLEFEILADNAFEIEQHVHKILNEHREFKGREFFRVDIWDATIEILKCVAGQFDQCVEQVDMCSAVYAISDLSHKVGVNPIVGCTAARFISEFAMRDAVSKYEKWSEERRNLYLKKKNNDLDGE